ncbi:hypothetical protein HK100_001086 [Physocladia obscura]|uniref:F-box domain-containing protein n=1 Tax=Physocladia obscura TaxID=109957 RepID=A0AAD5SZ31_9FUNG|nr:hypothetical protein HK100_001086 [Physocladia obscura]
MLGNTETLETRAIGAGPANNDADASQAIIGCEATSIRSARRSIADLPPELLSLILTYVATAYSDRDSARFVRVCRRWAAVMTPLIWENVVLLSPLQVMRFLRSVVQTVAYNNNKPHLLQIVSSIESSSLTDMDSLHKLDLSAMATMNTTPVAFVENLDNHELMEAAMNINNMNLEIMDVENQIAGIAQLMHNIVHLARTAPSPTSTMPSHSAAPCPSVEVILAQFFEPIPSINGNDGKLSNAQESSQHFGAAKFVKILTLPTFDCKVNYLALLNELLPNLQSIHFSHIQPDESPSKPNTTLFTPISSSLLETFTPIITKRLTKLSVEDIFPTTWPSLLKIFSTPSSPSSSEEAKSPSFTETQRYKRAKKQTQPPQHTLSNLRSINLEAVATTDSFGHPHKLSPHAFSVLPNLEAARFDGIALGSDAGIAAMCMFCTNLKVIALDYCAGGLTMASFSIMWNELRVLSFLGVAGIVNDGHNHAHMHENENVDEDGGMGVMVANVLKVPAMPRLQRHNNVRVVRLVDCDVTDGLFSEIAEAGNSLDMLRFVFEDDECEGILGIVERLTDAAIAPFAYMAGGMRRQKRKGLRRMAFTWCPGFSGDALKSVLEAGQEGIEVLDLHKDVSCALGAIPAQIFEDYGQYFVRIKVLNLYGQTQLSDITLSTFLTSKNLPVLESVCLNDTQVTASTLMSLVESTNTLRALSVISCSNVMLDDLKRMFHEIPKHMARIRRLYTEHCWNSKEKEGSENHNGMATNSIGSVGGGILSGIVESSCSGSKEDQEIIGTSHDAAEGESEVLNKSDNRVQPNPEPLCIIHDDLWFVDEGLDIMSLWNESVRQVTSIKV